MPQRPPYELELQRLPADQPLKRGDPRRVLLDQVGRPRVLVERACLVLADPDPDQVARNVVALREPRQRLARQEFLSDLTLELDAVRSVLHHGFHPPKARRPDQFTSADLSAPRVPLQS